MRITQRINHYEPCHNGMQKLWRCENNSKSAKRYEQRVRFRGKLNKSHPKIQLGIHHVSSIFNDQHMKNCTVS